MEEYTYYVGTLARYVLLDASNAREALEAGEAYPDLQGSPILTVRIATPSEKRLLQDHQRLMERERPKE